jgi:protein-disulfide isomerase
MGKGAKPDREGERLAPSGGWALSPGAMLGAIAVGMGAVLVLGFLNWQVSREIQASLGDRLTQIESRLAQISTKVDQVAARAPAPAQRGPDPSRVYTVRTDGAPVRGPSSAPVTIAEFSDFQ